MSVRVAIAGANGQIGTTLCRAWLGRSDIKPVAIVRNRLAEAVLKARVGEALEVRRGSPADGTSLAALVRDCDAAVNCAYAGGGIRQSRLQNIAIIEGLLAQPKLSRVVHLSSVAVYGFGEGYSPTNSYGREKLVHERAATRAAVGDPRRLTIVRVGHLIGAETPMSRAILEAISERAYSLPDLPDAASNCVGVSPLARGISCAVLQEGVYGRYDLVEIPNPAWQSVFAWHAGVCGLPAPALSGPVVSRLHLERSRRGATPSIWRMLAAGRMPFSSGALTTSSTLRYYLDGVLACMPEQVENVLRRRHAALAVKAQYSSGVSVPSLPEWLFQLPAPGQMLLAESCGRTDDDASRLRAWWRKREEPILDV